MVARAREGEEGRDSKGAALDRRLLWGDGQVCVLTVAVVTHIDVFEDTKKGCLGRN